MSNAKMRFSLFAVALALMAVMAIGFAGSTSAQTSTPSSGTTTQPAAPATGDTSGQAAPAAPDAQNSAPDQIMGGPGGPKGGPHGGHGGGRDGAGLGANTADAASRSLAQASAVISSTKADLSYANGKMDTATASDLVSKADALYSQAKSLSDSSKYHEAATTAQAAASAAQAASHNLAATLGAANLPSAANHPARPANDNSASTPSTTQQQAHISNDLYRTYNDIVNTAAKAKATTNLGDQSYYITTAQNAYKLAYDAYNKGNYEQAEEYTHMASDSIRVVDSLIHAQEQVPTPDANGIVTPPAPNFQ